MRWNKRHIKMETYVGTKTVEAEPMTSGDYDKGYISWSHKKQFEETYKKSCENHFSSLADFADVMKW